METLDTLVTYAYDLTLGGGAFYIGTSLMLYLVDRWRELEVKPRTKVPQAVNIPLELKAAETVPLPEVQYSQSLEAMPLEALPLEEPALEAPLRDQSLDRKLPTPFPSKLPEELPEVLPEELPE